MKLKPMLPSSMSSDVKLGKLQNLGLIFFQDYNVQIIAKIQEKCLIVLKCEVAAHVLESEIVTDPKAQDDTGIVLKSKQDAGIVLKPKHEVVAKSAAQIVHEQHQNNAPSERMAMTRRVHPLVSLNPYQGNWTIKVRLTSKGNLRTYKNARGEATMLAAQSIQLGINDVVVVGGIESMSNVPKYLAEARKGSRLGHDTLVDGMLKDGPWDVYNDYGMGVCAELCAENHTVTRDEQVAFAIQSFERGIAARDAGAFVHDSIISFGTFRSYKTNETKTQFQDSTPFCGSHQPYNKLCWDKAKEVNGLTQPIEVSAW